MNYLRFSFCLLLSFEIQAQNPTTKDTLKDFSYLLYGFKNIQKKYYQSQGTGFFIKTEDDIYFVTANHVVNGCVKNVKDTTKPDFMMLWQNKQGIYKEWHLNFNTKLIRDTSICRNRDSYPEIFVYKLGNPNTQQIKINCINNFIAEVSTFSKELIFYGFPSSNRNDQENVFDQKPALFKSNDFVVRSNLKHLAGQDVINYHIDIKDYKIDSSMRGFSGSPLFLKDYMTKKIVFAGILCAVDLINNTLYIVKPEYLFRKVNYVPKPPN